MRRAARGGGVGSPLAAVWLSVVASFVLASLLWWRIDRIPTERALHVVDFAGIGFSRNAHGQYQT